ncbi:MAG: hypothetical protein JSS98_13395 [Bacteroidetes bacterium]|nr:hypothetical protein [Bacteroidota bacterium]
MKLVLFKLRLHQLKRQINNLGFGYTLIAMIILAIIITIVFSKFHSKTDSILISIIISFIVLSIHISRKDKIFIYRQMDHPALNIFSEYMIFSLPLTLPALFTTHWYYFFAFIPVFFICALLRVSIRHRTILPHLSKVISAKNFEWLSGIRKNLGAVLILLLLAFATSWLKIVPLIFSWLFITTLMAFYQEGESLQILFSSTYTPRQFLWHKVKYGIAIVLFLLIPVIVVNIIFHPELLLLDCAFLVMQLTMVVFTILFKYTTYVPNEVNRGNSTLLAMLSISSLVPYTFPLPLLLCIRNYSKAVKNLNFYFNGQHTAAY